MKLIHSSDHHHDFYATRLGNMRIENGRNTIYTERLERTKQIILNSLKEDGNLFIFSGDFHNKLRPPPQEYNDVFELFDLIPPDKGVFIIPGNHDEPTDRGCPLQALKGRKKNVLVALKCTTVEYRKVQFVLAPWRTPFETIKEAVSLCTKDTPIVLVAHVAVIAQGLNWGETEGEVGTVTIEELQSLGCSRILLGHYHGQVELAKNIWYAGSPEIYNFGEEDQVKGYLVWDTDKDEVQHRDTVYPAFRTYTVDDFLGLVENKVDAYIRIKGETTEEQKVAVLSKLKDFECLGYKLDLASAMKARKLYFLKGKSNVEILTNYFKGKEVENIEELVKLDQKIESEARE